MKYILFINLLFSTFLIGQVNSFVHSIDTIEQQLAYCYSNDFGDITFCTTKGTLQNQKILIFPKYSANSNNHLAKMILPEQVFKNNNFSSTKSTLENGNKVFIDLNKISNDSTLCEGGFCLINLDNGTAFNYCQRNSEIRFRNSKSLSVSSSGSSFLFLQGIIGYPIKILKLEENGNIILSKEINVGSPITGVYSYFKNNKYYLGLNGETTIFLKLDTMGTIENSINFSKELLDLESFVVDNQDNIWALGASKNQSSTSGNFTDLALFKFDNNLNPQLANIYSAEKFHLIKSSIINSENGLFITYSTGGNFPAILAKLDFNGNILSQIGYPFYSPNMALQKDGSLIFTTTSSRLTNGILKPNLLFAKTDSLGKLDNCPTYPTCLKKINIPIPKTSTPTILERPYSHDFERRGITLIDTFITSAPFCQTPEPPNASFILPDTVCNGACLELDGLNNHDAQGILWDIQSGNQNLSWELDSFSFCFEKSDQYTVRQKVWFLGCSYESEKELTVLNPLEAEFNHDSIICSEAPLKIQTIANRPLKSITWNSIDTAFMYLLYNSGELEATVSDGFCMDTVTRTFSFVQDLIGPNGQVLTLPRDTQICSSYFPFELKPISDFTSEFFLEGMSGKEFVLEKPGRYQVTAYTYGCLFKKEFFLDSDACLPNIFIPNVFSPNGDGINDLFEPFGTGFEVKSLDIYDRWGGLVYRGKSWDGFAKNGKKAGEGVYVYRLRIINTLTGEILVSNGDLSLLR